MTVSNDKLAFAIVKNHCTVCHSSMPVHEGFHSAPKNIYLDSFEEVMANYKNIIDVSVKSHYMPLGNVTKMTIEERSYLGKWLYSKIEKDK